MTFANPAESFRVPAPPDLAEREGRHLVALARTAVLRVLGREAHPIDPPRGGPLLEPAGAFVTIYRNEELRGCLGVVSSPDPLWRTVAELASASATRDPRFEPVTAEEVDDLIFEVSVLGPVRAFPPVGRPLPGAIQVGEHGLLLRARGRSGLLLPQVAVRYGWDSLRFLEEVCLKASLSTDAWMRPGAEVSAFRTRVFGAGSEGHRPEAEGGEDRESGH